MRENRRWKPSLRWAAAAAVIAVTAISVSCSSASDDACADRSTPTPPQLAPYSLFPDSPLLSEGGSPATATAGLFGTPEVDPAVHGRLPDAPLPDGFYLPDAGAANFDQYTRVLTQSGDWLLATHATSAYPIPSGWTTVTSFVEENFIVFGRDGVQVDGFAIRGAEISVRVSRRFQSHTTDINEILDGHESQVLAEPSVVVLGRAAFGPNRGYLLIEGPGNPGQYAVIYLTRRAHQTGVGFDSLVASWSADGADEYYSIVRTIVGGWVDLNNCLLGAQLPEALPAS